MAGGGLITNSEFVALTGTGVLGAETTRFKRSVWRRSFNTLADLPTTLAPKLDWSLFCRFFVP